MNPITKLGDLPIGATPNEETLAAAVRELQAVVRLFCVYLPPDDDRPEPCEVAHTERQRLADELREMLSAEHGESWDQLIERVRGLRLAAPTSRQCKHLRTKRLHHEAKVWINGETKIHAWCHDCGAVQIGADSWIDPGP